MFYGQYSVNIDSKGRISLPKPIKESLTGVDVLLNEGFDGALFVFDRSAWEASANRYLEKPLNDEDARLVRRQTFAHTFVVKVDDQGRILIPQRILHVINLKGPNQLIVIGAGDHFEIWLQTAWEEYIERIS